MDGVTCHIGRPVRGHFDADAAAPFVADRNHRHDFPALDFLPVGLLGPLARYANLKLTHRALEPQQHPLVQCARVVNPFGVDHEGLGQHAQIDQVMPIAIVPCQP